MEKFGDTIHRNKWESYLIAKPIYWAIDWRDRRKLTNLKEWFNIQLDNASDELILISHSLKGITDDGTIINILRWVHKNITYVGDSKKWNTPEYWEPYQNVYDTKEGDCESMNGLMMLLARLAGIPYYKLRLTCGSVVGGGHAYLLYSPDLDAIDRVIDSCYWYNGNQIKYRKYYENNQNYINEWFSFNDKQSFGKFSKNGK